MLLLFLLIASSALFFLTVNRLRIRIALNKAIVSCIRPTAADSGRQIRTVTPETVALLPDPVKRYAAFCTKPGQAAVHTAACRSTERSAGGPPQILFSLFSDSGRTVELIRSRRQPVLRSSVLLLSPDQQQNHSLLYGLFPAPAKEILPQPELFFLRYISRMPWLPTAFFQPGLYEWKHESRNSARLIYRYSGRELQMSAEFDTAGTLCSLTLNSETRHPLRAEYSNYIQSGCMRIPGFIRLDAPGLQTEVRFLDACYNPPRINPSARCR